MNYQKLSALAQGADWAAAEKAKVDLENLAILANRQKGLDARDGIGVGDFVIIGDKSLRVAHDWGDAVQLTDGRFGASFYLSDNGFVDFSGGLDPAINRTKFTPTDERRDGPVWFFSQNYAAAHNGYYTNASFRVWTLN